MTNHRATANDVLNEYLQRSRGTSTQWSYVDEYSSTATISDAFRELAYHWQVFKIGDWIVSDDTDNPLEPIGIEEII